MCDLFVETLLGFAAELSPGGPPDDEATRQLLLWLLELQILWAKVVYNYCWTRLRGDTRTPGGSIQVAAMSAWAGSFLHAIGSPSH